uniref:Uncharacterized protein n=1 Tax=Globisporangium ultimum (strain ATCC 200006 / CBS 805.95 / DAOM BR144) TaxID=431595 RepID=K3X0N2_GLOUD
MTVFFEKRNKVKRRLGQLKRRLHQFQLILGFPRPLGDEVELQKYKIAYQEVLLQERVDFCEAIAAQRLYKRLQSWKEAAGSSEFSVSSSNCDEEESIFLSQDQYFGCTEWLTRHLYDREYFQKHMLPLLLNGWIAIMPVDLEKEDSWLAL